MTLPLTSFLPGRTPPRPRARPVSYTHLDVYKRQAYIHSEKDILKLVTTLIANTKGEGKAGDDFWVKAETLLYCALIGYIHYEAPVCLLYTSTSQSWSVSRSVSLSKS